MLQEYIYSFLIVAVIVIFTISIYGKIGNLDEFISTIARFDMILNIFQIPAAIIIIISEVLIILLTMMQKTRLYGFVLATILLFVFSIALASVLARGIKTPCHCLNASKEPLNQYDLWRNFGFLLITLGGWIFSLNHPTPTMTLIEWCLMTLIALIFITFLSNLNDIISLARAST